jgi:hypothetical protein
MLENFVLKKKKEKKRKEEEELLWLTWYMQSGCWSMTKNLFV